MVFLPLASCRLKSLYLQFVAPSENSEDCHRLKHTAADVWGNGLFSRQRTKSSDSSQCVLLIVHKSRGGVFTIYYLCMCTCVNTTGVGQACQGACVTVRGQVCVLFSFHFYEGSRNPTQATRLGQQVPLPTESICLPKLHVFQSREFK